MFVGLYIQYMCISINIINQMGLKKTAQTTKTDWTYIFFIYMLQTSIIKVVFFLKVQQQQIKNQLS